MFLPIGISHLTRFQALMFNFALDGNGNPKLPGTSSCGGSTGPGCRSIFQVNSDGSYAVNQGFYAIAQVGLTLARKFPTFSMIGKHSCGT